MPGGGKSTVGRLLARRLEVSFIDVDDAIERRYAASVSALFAARGEDAFRDIEADVLAESTIGGAAVVATGGGAVVRERNRALLREATIPVYLHASLPELWRRVRRNSRRPLLQVSDPRARLAQLFEERHPLYCETARIVVETGEPPMSRVVDEIVARLQALPVAGGAA